MGKIWLETTEGRLIHLPVIGGDVNTPDDAVRIPTSLILNVNRCYSQPISINSPQYGNFTIDLTIGSNVTGSCNQCGQCCTHPVEQCNDPVRCVWTYRADIDCHACPYLTVSKVQKWGDPNNTECSVYSTILNVFKGCAYPPDTIFPWMTSCGSREV